LAHINNYEFPQNFRYRDWNGGGTGLQPDVAGGYAWLMLGLYDLTHTEKYLDEAKASIAHVAGKGFDLAYETQMTAYSAAAAQRLYSMTKDVSYRGYATLALANLFHATRLWDCTYGLCRKGTVTTPISVSIPCPGRITSPCWSNMKRGSVYETTCGMRRMRRPTCTPWSRAFSPTLR
jgi:hypothetical protein